MLETVFSREITPLIHIAMGMITLYYLSFILYYKKLFPALKKTWAQIAFTLTAIVSCYILLVMFNVARLSIPVIFVPMVWGLRFSTGMSWRQSVYGAGLCVLTAHCFRAIVTAICALLLLGRLDEFFLDSRSYYAVTVFILPLGLVFFYLLRKTILPDGKLKKLLSDSRNLTHVIVFELTATVLLLIMAQGRFLSPHVEWYIEITLGASLLSLVVLVYTLYYAVQSSEFVDHQLRTRLLEEQYDRQLRHYQSYQKFTESFRKFKHDYKAMMADVKALIRENKSDEAAAMMDAVHDTMQREICVHKTYSNNLVADAILQDTANLCMENNIRFSATAYMPESLPLSRLDLVRVFSNITSNAVEACRKLKEDSRFITISSSSFSGWVSIEVQNSFDGVFRMKDGWYQTNKADRDIHGYGLRIISEIIEKSGGFVTVTANAEKRLFIVKLHIPNN